eukprot:363941-Chlamydomonas_euryale.AAC.5
MGSQDRRPRKRLQDDLTAVEELPRRAKTVLRHVSERRALVGQGNLFPRQGRIQPLYYMASCLALNVACRCGVTWPCVRSSNAPSSFGRCARCGHVASGSTLTCPREAR